jgi:hypothetical protein
VGRVPTLALSQVKQFLGRNPTAAPDFALIMIGVSNRWNLENASFWRWADNPSGDRQMRRLVSQLQLSKAHSVLAENARGAANGGQINGYDFRENLDEHGWDVFFTSFEDPLLARWIETDLRDLARQLREREVTPVFLSYHYLVFSNLNPLLKRVADRVGAMWLDIEEPGEFYARRRLFDPDGFHLNAEGYRDLARRIAFEFQQRYPSDELQARLAVKQALCAGPTL